jgi:Rrf2 family nitric oxide-sensitive transcriptional repressor
MRLKIFTDYSLRVLIFLAARPQRRGTIAEIADAFDISENHLMKVSHALGKAGVLANVRGKGGGLELAMAPKAINVGHVVRITEGAPHPAECFDPGCTCCIARACTLRRVLDDAVQAFYAVLDRYTLEDIARNRNVLARMLALQRPTRARAFGGTQIVRRLQIQPELGRVAKVTCKAKRSVCRHPSLAVHDVVHSCRRNVNRLRQRVRRHSQWHKKFLAQDFARVNRTHVIPGHARSFSDSRRFRHPKDHHLANGNKFAIDR